LVDAVCFLKLGHVFAEMMTGNFLLLAFSVAMDTPFSGGQRYLPAIAAFTVGALLGGRVLRGPDKLRERRSGFAIEWLVLLGATVYAGIGDPTDQNLAGAILVAALALAMGLQNAMIRVHGVPDLATNVMTLTFTGLIADSAMAGGDNRNWRRRALSIGLFCASAAVGAWLLQYGLAWPLVLASAIFTVAMLPLMFGVPERR
jgi:uncharacterized membrane protein YoaK (UPF0700 family)